MADDSSNFDYSPGRHSQEGDSAGPEVISWTASEYIEHNRGKSWYMLLTLGTIVLAAAIYLLTKDLFAAIITLILGIIVASVAHRKPNAINYQLSSDGLKAGDRFHNFNEYRSFAIVHEGQLGSLMLIPLKKFTAPVSMYIEGDDEESIIALLGEHLPMEERTADKVDTLTRRLRF
jgi:hypothetical protein